MFQYPEIRPYIFKFGPIQVRWYGLMYLLGFVASYALVLHQIKKRRLDIQKEDVENLYLYIIIGLIVGARLGYIVFYNIAYYIEHPLELIAVWHGGMSFHGGFAGALAGGIVYCRRHKLDFWLMADLLIVTAPIGLGLGRIGNFINGELYGRPTNVPWGMVFPFAGPMPRHPSQLYEFFLEGVVMFTLMWVVRDRAKGMLLFVFIMLYGLFRFIVEFFREPDQHLGMVLGPLTMGQLLSLSMLAAGAIVSYILWRRRASSPIT
ncbi:prolipoprotein diacylglyceryl transferase [Candidatus Magnetobacterium bavaricum]|uniref:Phosphatidylglycerol--prolipoprotein diacylglyceryl transferase n=1 Tax=Candidatus Magnetobacterium bavaricum TaxID=29290 RepID=A0A0F3GJ34_9BACT|nr:prolipoprotein diacylglyceryl transferase [Candidatus Magnetobacterium bavaricum]